MTTGTPREEERAARQRQRQLDKMQRGAAKKRDDEARTKLQRIIREEQAMSRWRECHCGITLRMTWAEIKSMEGCKAGRHGQPGWICPTLDAIRRKMGR